jgi:glutamate carboxypeptidase
MTSTTVSLPDAIDPIKWIINWSNINSHTPNIEGIDRFRAQLISDAAVLGAQHEELSFPPHSMADANGNVSQVSVAKGLRLFKRPEAPIQILLMGHLDTVHPKSGTFQEVTRKENALIGPGVTDMKGGIAVMLYALHLFESSPHSNNIGWEVLLNSDEEIGSLSSAEYICKRASEFDLGLVYEPATESGDMIIERKGSSNFSLIAHGKEAHVGRNFNDGQSAISDMASLIHDIQALPVSKEVILNFGLINGGTATNTVPNLCICHCNIRGEDMEAMNRFYDAVEELISHKNSELARSTSSEKSRPSEAPKGSLQLVKISQRPPKLADDTTRQIYEHVRSLVLNNYPNTQLTSTGGSSDGNYLAHNGLTTIDSLGVMGSGIHTSNETCIIPSVKERAQLTTQLLIDVATQKIAL